MSRMLPLAVALGLIATWSPARAAGAKDEGPVTVEADELSGKNGESAQAKGHVVVKRGDLTLKSDELDYRLGTNRATARGNVTLESPETSVSGPEMGLKLDTFEGAFVRPTYRFKRNGAGGQAERIEFLDRERSISTEATYSSCRREDYPEGDTIPWELKTRRLRLDFARNEGIAEGAVLRFYGVPILAAPVMSFPLSDDRKTGWLPPHIGFDTRSGLSLSAPWYWNLAPNHDATLSPILSSKRGAGLAAEYRYLQPTYHGVLQTHDHPRDLTTDSQRWSGLWTHDGRPTDDTDLQLRWHRASDGDYWKDFPSLVGSVTPRLLSSQARGRWHWDHDWGRTTAYGGVQGWQVLQDPASIVVAPYTRAPQLGVVDDGVAHGLHWRVQAEAARFTHPDANKIRGTRAFTQAMVERPFGDSGYTFTPRLAINATAYDTDRAMSDGSTRATRVLPTFSLDNQWVLERDTTLFGRGVTQTLEPRLQYVYTPYRAQSQLPVFDSTAQDFNFSSIYAENPFAGQDRIADANQVTGGLTTRFVDAGSGAESLRLGVVQRLLLRDQRITADDGAPLTQRWSDLLLLGSTSIIPNWSLDASVQYSPEIERTQRSTMTARYFPGPYRTIALTYRFTRNQSEQVDVGWQWPVFGPPSGADARASASGGSGRCGGAWYSVGRVNYSLKERSITDSILGLEYDAGCWVGRFFASRLSTGRTEAVTGAGIEIEFVGLSSLPFVGSMKTLRDNIPGYQPLRGNTGGATSVP